MKSKIREIIAGLVSPDRKNILDTGQGSHQIDAQTILIILIALISLVFTQYFAIRPGYRMLAALLQNLHIHSWSQTLTFWMESAENPRINRLAYWICIILIFYLGAPIICIKFVLKQRLRDYGVCIGKSFSFARIYAVMMVIMVPLVLLVSSGSSFLHTYPFYKPAQGESLYPYFWLWQILYLLQFICVEFFFRGFMVHGLRPRFGFYSVLIMTIPYCMIHFGKPMPEAFGAIVAGIILGALSYYSRSIIPGILIHFSIAFTMDIAAVWRMGLLK